MGGSDTVRGISYQHAHAVLSAFEVIESAEVAGLRVEGKSDAIDIELLDACGRIILGKQVKIRSEEYSWSKADIVRLLREWIAEDAPEFATYQFVTNGQLGPSGKKVKRALEEAASGSRDDLARLLDMDADGAAVRKAARATVVQDASSAGAIVVTAERRARALLPMARSSVDAEDQATRAIDSLSRLIWDRAGKPDASDRLITRDEICLALGIPPTAVAIEPWVGAIRERYIAEVSTRAQDFVSARVHTEDLKEQFPDESVGVILNQSSPVVLTGRTGAGKSTAARELRDFAAATGRAAIVVNAEAYLPGRIDSLVADAVSDVVDREVPTLTGRQALSEPSLILVIDGASEVPRSTRDELGEDLRAYIASRRWAKVVLVGRDAAAMRAMLPTTVTPVTCRIAPFDRSRRLELAKTQIGEADDRAVMPIVARAEEALGDAAGNPLLLKMAIDSILSGTEFSDRAAVYGSAISRIGARVGAEELAVVEVVLGVCFARLLDQGRRYADPYTWRQIFMDVVREESSKIGWIDPENVLRSAQRSGLLARAGHSATVTALHDSFADYLAGAALAKGVVPFPSNIRPIDEDRLLFAAQKGRVDRQMTAAIASNIPFALPRLAALDKRDLGESAPEEVSTLLASLLPADAPSGADLWRVPDGRVFGFLSEGPGGWIGPEQGREAFRTRAGVIGAGPADLASRLWRQWLRSMLPAFAVREHPFPKSGDEACEAVVRHVADVAKEAERLLCLILPPQHRNRVAEEMGPMGITARLSPEPEGTPNGRAAWRIVYSRTEDVDVKLADSDVVDGGPQWRSTIDSMIGRPAAAEAAERISRSIDRMAGGRWL